MPKIIDHESYRKELLSNCLDIFAAKGFGTITMRELAAELGVSTGTLYHYWKGKQEIFNDLVIYLTEQDSQLFIDNIGAAKSLEKRVEALFEFLARHEEYFRKQFMITLDYYRQQGANEAVTNNQVVQRSNLLHRGMVAHFLGIADQEIISFVLSALSGSMFARIYEGERVSLQSQAKILSQMLRLYMKKDS